MKKIGMIVNDSNSEAIDFGCVLASWVKEDKGEVFVTSSLSSLISPSKVVGSGGTEEFFDAIDVLIVLGGDGTMLRAVKLVAGLDIPVMGINLGGLGFLTSVTVKEAREMTRKVLRGDFSIEQRMMLSVDLERDGKLFSSHKVLNEAVVKGLSVRLIRLETSINKEYVTTYRADGLIVATPTGSTAYSLSASGPILYPTIHSIIVAPICPFNLMNRPVVIPDWMSVEITVCPEQDNISLVLDGEHDVSIECGDVITIKRAETSVYLIKYEGKSYFDILRERLMWDVK
ncbi:MAG: NAD(+)/NADH kinase [Thermodesulfobacteriota bacterium]